MIDENIKNFIKEAQIPVLQKKPKTFQSITKQPHYENVLSNIYAFYFDVEEEHGLGELFIQSLFDTLNENGVNDLPFNFLEGFDVDTEVDISKMTNSNGRIDVLLSNGAEAIIIENKVYHHIENNPLDAYWESQKGNERIGLVMSLKPKEGKDIPHKHFFSITHMDFLTNVMKNIGSRILNANDKYVLFLKDVYQNIINLTTNNMNEQDLNFYYNYIEKINEIEAYKKDVRKHIVSQVEDVLPRLDLDLELYKSRGKLRERLRYFKSKKNPNLMFTISFGNLLNTKLSLGIFIEIKHGLLKKAVEINNIDFTHNEKIINKNFLVDSKQGIWAHFVKKTYCKLSTEKDIPNLTDFIIDKIESDGLIDVFNKIEDVISEN